MRKSKALLLKTGFMPPFGVIEGYSGPSDPVDYADVLRPNGDGDIQEFELSGIYNETIPWVGSTFGGTHLWQIDDYTRDGVITSVRVSSYSRIKGGATATSYAVVKTHGELHLGVLPTHRNYWAAYMYTWSVNPATGIAWTLTEVNDLQVGGQLAASFMSPAYLGLVAANVESTFFPPYIAPHTVIRPSLKGVGTIG